MKELKEILSVLNSPYLEKLPVIGDAEEETKSLQAKLVDGIKKSQFNTDQDAAKGLYGKIYNKHSFEVLKSKLKQRALSSLLLYEIKDTESSPRDAMRIHLQRQLISCNLLLLFGARAAGVELLSKMLTTSSTFFLNDCSIQALSYLRSHYWYIGDTISFEKASKQLNDFIVINNAEIKAEEVFQNSTIRYSQSGINKESKLKRIENGLKEFKKLNKYISKSYIIQVYKFKLEMTYYHAAENYHKVAIECEKAIRYFDKDKIFRNDPFSIFFLINQCEAYFLSGNYEKMFGSVDELRKLIGIKASNRAAVEIVSFYANVYTGRYDEAERVLDKIDIQKIPILPLQIVEIKLFRAYIALVKYLNIAKKSPSDQLALKSLELPPLSKDKHGSNISILICDTVYNILLKDYTKLLKLDKKLDNYIYRYLSKDRLNERSVIFLKMLRIVFKEDFDIVRIEKKTNLLFKKLQLNKTRSFAEIVPFQELWSLLLQSFTS